MLPTSSKGANEGTPIAAAPPNLRTKPSPEPSPFFDIASAIDDFYNGDVYEAFSEAERVRLDGRTFHLHFSLTFAKI